MREYDPGTGRFLQEDPIWFDSGDHNVYRYTWNNPVMWTDPSGMLAVEYANQNTLSRMMVSGALTAGVVYMASDAQRLMQSRSAIQAVGGGIACGFLTIAKALNIVSSGKFVGSIGNCSASEEPKGDAAPSPPPGAPDAGSETKPGAGSASPPPPGSSQSSESDTRTKPPPGSRKIEDTAWSGNHGEIKDSIGARGDDSTKIDTHGNVWGQNLDGTWTNHGPARNFIEGNQAAGQRGSDRLGPRQRANRGGGRRQR